MKDLFHILLTGIATGLVAFLGFLPSVHAETLVADGYIQADTTWDKAHSPYVLQDVVTVPAGLTLTMEPGTQVVLDPTSQYDPYIYVAGRLVLGGSAHDHIKVDGVWGITVDHGRADISYADISMKGPLMFGGATGSIATSTISNSVDDVLSDGVLVKNSAVTITGSTIQENLNGVVVKDGGAVFQVRVPGRDPFSSLSGLFQRIGLVKTAHAQAAPSVVSISGSRFIGNTQNAVRNNASDAVVALANWWGSPSGPTVQSGTSRGVGNSVQGPVVFTPWLDRDPMEQKPVATCCSSVLFLPGIEASRLYRPESIMGGVGMTINRLWEPNKNDDVRKLFLNPDGTSIDSAIYAGSPLGRVFGLVDIYGSFMKFMDGLVAQGSISEWEPFGYDWRQSIVSVVEHPTARATTTESLIKTVEDMAARSQTGKVTLLAHSNGGLVAKQLVKVLADMGKASLIDSVISVAVPYLGTPQAIAGLLEGDSQSIFGGLILKKSVAKELGTNMASAYSLLPSATYFSKVFGPTIAYAGGTSTSVTTVQEQDSFISSRANALLMALAQTVHASIDPFVWPEAIHRWALVGWGNVTKKGIVYNNKGYTATTTIMGDSTVVAPSASYNAGTTTALDLPTISKQEGHKIDHANILGSVAVQSSIERIIASDNSAYNSKSIEDSLNAIPGVLVGDIDYSKEKTFLVVSTHSPVELHVYDSKGNHTGVAPLPAGADEDIEDGLYTFTESKIPGSSIELHGDDQPETFISLPDDTGQLYSVNIQGTGVGEFTYVVQRVRGGEVLDNAVYSSLPVTPLMVATTTVTAQTADLSIAVGIASTSPSIKIDIDGDGSSDIRVDANKGLDPISFLESLKKTIQKISDSPKRTKDIVKRIDTIEELIRKGKVKRVIGAATNLKKKVLHKKVKALSITDKQEIVNLIDAFLAQFE